MRKSAEKTPSGEQVVQADAAYTLNEFRRRTGLGQAAMRSARKAGLAVIYVGGRGFVMGKSWLDHLTELQCQQQEDGQ